MPRRKPPVPWRNRSADGWWAMGEVQYFVPRPSPGHRATPRRYRVWQNVRILQARDRDAAYRKALRLARAALPSDTDAGQWRFAGLSFLLPIYESLEDGSEIIWDDLGNLSPAKLKALVKSKRALSVFDDRPKM